MNNKNKINNISLNGRVLWLYTKYQIISKLIVALIIFPVFGFFIDFLIKSTGRTNISSGDYIGFIFSIYGILVIILSILLLIVILGLDINTFIIISSLIQEKKYKMKIMDIILTSIKSLKHFFSLIGLFIIVFISFILPIIGFGITLGPFENFKVPNFITSVIFNNQLYSFLYWSLIVILIIISIIYIFTLHFVIVDGRKINDALKSSRLLIKKYWKNFVVDYIFGLIRILIIFLLATAIFVGLIFLITELLVNFNINDNVLTILFLLSVSETVSFLLFISVPIIISLLTKLFYRYNKLEGRDITFKLETKSQELSDYDLESKIKFKTKFELTLLIVLVVIFNFTVGIFAGNNFDEIFKTNINVELVAHRGGGDLGAENTIDGIDKAIKANAKWTEIDVQRTLDGAYIINHDKTFLRVAGVDKKPMEMTLAEIKELKVKNEFEPNTNTQKVPTFEEILDACKNKIGVFVELKGQSADKKMVDDVVMIIKNKDMLDECVILSLDYSIIEYTALNYPEIKTGFLYFFSYGELKDLKGDYLIMEEREASAENIAEIHAAGKKAVVWTVNTPESINEFIYSDVDGIITDHIPLINDAINKSKERSNIEIIIDSFIN